MHCIVIEHYVVTSDEACRLARHAEVLGLGNVPDVALATCPCDGGGVAQGVYLYDELAIFDVEALLGGLDAFEDEVFNIPFEVLNVGDDIFACCHTALSVGQVTHHLDDGHQVGRATHCPCSVCLALYLQGGGIDLVGREVGGIEVYDQA